MGRRWSVNTRLWAYRYLCLRDGEECANCHAKPTAQNKLEIDHLDGNFSNNDSPNLRLLCKGCNVHFENLAAEEKAALARERSDQNERERGKPTTQIVREAVNYKDGSPEMQANYLFEMDFREWILSKVAEQGNYPKKQAIFAGAELVGCSPTTTTRYLEKLLSDHGPLTTQKDLLGDLQLVFKESKRELGAPVKEPEFNLEEFRSQSHIIEGKGAWKGVTIEWKGENNAKRR